jgi:hypothetical protein
MSRAVKFERKQRREDYRRWLAGQYKTVIAMLKIAEKPEIAKHLEDLFDHNQRKQTRSKVVKVLAECEMAQVELWKMPR